MLGPFLGPVEVLRHNVQLHLKLARARGCVLVRNLTMNCCLSPKWSVSLETAAKPVGPASWPRSPPQGSQPRGCPRATPAASPGPVSGKTPLQFLPLSPQCTSLLAVPDTSALSYRPLSPQTPPTARIFGFGQHPFLLLDVAGELLRPPQHRLPRRASERPLERSRRRGSDERPSDLVHHPLRRTVWSGDPPEDRHHHVVAELSGGGDARQVGAAFVGEHRERLELSSQHVGEHHRVQRDERGFYVGVVDGLYGRL